MFPRQGIGNPLQQFGAIHPLQQIALSARCPVCGTPAAVSSLLQSSQAGVSPFATGIGGVSPIAPQVGGFGVSPLASAQAPGLGTINPFLTPQLAGTTYPTTHPMVAAQLSQVNPALLASLYQQPGGGEFVGQFGQSPITQLGGGVPGGYAQLGQQPWALSQLFGGQSPVGQFGGQSPFGLFGTGSSAGFGQIGQQQVPWAVNPNILAQVLANPALASDPIVASLIAQQLNPMAQQQPPIRPLMGGQQQFQPFQGSGIGSIGGIPGQGIDPYTALLISQLTQSPYHQIVRAYTGSPWGMGYGSQFGAGQSSPLGQGIGF
ncbi:MAG TPA: hypothetical protein VNO70_00960 [Blastocatellia bacterium]|nr:hypothetical protein [Blastocatellia bacterium]